VAKVIAKETFKTNPASAIERIEVINNPSAKYDANENATISNVIFKKEIQEGFNDKVGLALGRAALWIKEPKGQDKTSCRSVTL